MSDSYAVFGNPIKHSLSPLIHRAFAKQTGKEITYQRRLVALGQFEAQASAFFADGGKGLNVTVPFKLDACRFADRLTERARRAGAVNTLAMQNDGLILGDNTDGVGLARDIVVNKKWRVEGCDLLVLGAGGAVRGALEPLLVQKPASLVIANRTESKAQYLASEFDDLGKIEGVGLDALTGRSFDLVINATSASLGGSLPPIPSDVLKANSCCYDMMYAAEPTIFLLWAEQQGVTHLADGLGMLVEQAGEAFYLWQGVRPETESVIHQIRSQLA